MRRKTVFVNLVFVQFHWLNQKYLFKQIQICHRIYPFTSLLRKTNFLSISVLLSEIVIFWLKREVLSEFPKKPSKQQRSIVYLCVSFWGKKQFLFIFVQFYCFEQKGLFTTNPNFPLDLLLFKLVEKNKLSDYFWASSRDNSFLTKKRIFQWISPKMLQKTGKHNLAVCGLFGWEKQYLLIFVPIYYFIQKGIFTTNPNFHLDLLLF